MPTLTDLWTSLSVGELVGIALVWLASFGSLAIMYGRASRWDQAWKQRWEQRHGTSLETFRQKKQQMLKVLTVIRWVMLALVFMSVGASVGPIISAINGLLREPTLIIVGYAFLNLLTLLLFGFFAGGARLTKYQLQRIGELLRTSSRQ